MTSERTSSTHPLRVDWLPTPWTGRVGLTFAPGKNDRHAATGAWARDLRADLERLRDEYQAQHLICLVEDHELALLQIEQLPQEAASVGLAFHRLPIRDVSTPADSKAVAELVSNIEGWAAGGANVVIHCRGGLGRAGTVGGCVLRAAGSSAEDALAALAEARGPNCPETTAQRDYVRAFVPGLSLRTRVVGAVLGAAIGDALGHPTEFHSYGELEAKYGAGGVKGYELWWEHDEARFAPYTDDTQMAEIVLRALVDHGSEPADFEETLAAMAAGFAYWRDYPQGGHRAPGNSCMAGAGALASGIPWREAGGKDAGGCGSVMRAYPFGLMLHDDIERAERWSVEHSRMTHQAPIALAACAAMAVGMAHEMSGSEPSTTLKAMVAAAARYDDAGTATMAQRAVEDAHAGTDPIDVLRTLQGWAAHEAIAAAMFVVARHPDDVRAALLEAANASGDSDSIATMAGALLGARHGIAALPAEWVRDVERSAELLELASAAADNIERRTAG